MKNLNVEEFEVLTSFEMSKTNGGFFLGGSDLGNWLIDGMSDAYNGLPSWSEIKDAMSQTLNAGYGIN